MPDLAICDSEGCKQPATHTYTWDWGKSGVCCSTHQTTNAQLSGNLKRRVTFAAINPGAELAECKQRGLELYQENTKLVGQVQLLTVQNRELEAQARDAKGELGAVEKERDGLKVELANSNDELQRLRTIAKPSKSK
jgi:hypothetical protein